MQRIFGYCRISRPTQNIERQERNIIKSYPTARIYKEAYTGTKTTGRKELEKLLKDPDLCVKYGKAAYEQMDRLWNPQVAARNVLTLADDLTEGRRSSIKEGPCSAARILKNNWFNCIACSNRRLTPSTQQRRGNGDDGGQAGGEVGMGSEPYIFLF